MDLNVKYVENFLSEEKSDELFDILDKLEFTRPTLTVRGKTFTPPREVIAFGDAGLSYDYSGIHMPALPWTPELYELKKLVEKETQCVYNYVLLNRYKDGSVRIGAHKDNEKSLDSQSSSIACVSLGAHRDVVFTRPGHPAKKYPLKKGSLYVMIPPTNLLWSHAIPPQTEVKEPRISATFRKVISTPATPPRVQLSTKRSAPPPPPTPRKMSKKNDEQWMQQYVEGLQAMPARTIREWHLQDRVWLRIVNFQNQLKVHIRMHDEVNGIIRPSKSGIAMHPATWAHFALQLPNSDALYPHQSFVTNNELIAICNGSGLNLQQIYETRTGAYQMNTNQIHIHYEQFNHINEYSEEVTNLLLKELLCVHLYELIDRKTLLEKTDAVMTLDSVESVFIDILNCELFKCVRDQFVCRGCMYHSGGQLSHDCITQTSFQQYESIRDLVILSMDWDKMATEFCERTLSNAELFKEMTCYHWRLEDYYKHFENVLMKNASL